MHPRQPGLWGILGNPRRCVGVWALLAVLVGCGGPVLKEEAATRANDPLSPAEHRPSDTRPQTAASAAEPMRVAPSVAPSSLPAASIIERFCKPQSGPVAETVTVLRNAAGNIGGYVLVRSVMDSPVFYLDPQGEQLALFHIFGSDQEKHKNAPIIDALRAGYPLESALQCSAVGK